MSLAPDGLPYWSPKTGVFVSESGDLVIEVDVGQCTPEYLELTAEGTRVRITANRAECVVESPSESDLSKAKASYLNGVLRIEAPCKPIPPILRPPPGPEGPEQGSFAE